MDCQEDPRDARRNEFPPRKVLQLVTVTRPRQGREKKSSAREPQRSDDQ
jgi:hypothetical protein